MATSKSKRAVLYNVYHQTISVRRQKILVYLIINKDCEVRTYDILPLFYGVEDPFEALRSTISNMNERNFLAYGMKIYFKTTTSGIWYIDVVA